MNLPANHLWKRLSFCLFLLAGTQTNDAQLIPTGKGFYRKDLPAKPDGSEWRQVDKQPLVSDRFNGSIPTCDWWSSLIWPVHSPHSQPMFPHPLGVQATEKGLGLSYTAIPSFSHSEKDGKIFQTGTSYKYPYRQDLLVGLQDWTSEDAVADACSDWSVTALWQNNSDRLRATFAHGSPFVYFEREGNKPIEISFKAAKINRSETPVNPLVFRSTNITSTHSGKAGAIKLAVNAGKNVGIGSKARLTYDFEGDGKIDRVETFAGFATDPVEGTFETYSSEKQSIDQKLTHGEMRDFDKGTVTLEFWKCFGNGDLSLQLSSCEVQLPIESDPVYPSKGGGLAATPASEIATLSDSNKEPGAAQIFYQEGAVIGVTINDTHYGIFAPTGSKWEGVSEGRSSSLTSDLAGKNYLSVAVLPDSKSSTLKGFQNKAYAFIAETDIKYAYAPEKAAVTTTFTVKTEAKEGTNLDTIMALYRHQHLHLVETDQLSKFTYASPRGVMKVLSGTSFSTQTPFMGILPALPNAKTNRDELKQLLEKDYQQILSRKKTFERDDTYWNGKEFGKFSELIHIADQLNKNEVRDKLVSLLKQRIEDWFDAQVPLFFYYDNSWNTLVGYPDSYGSADQFNDHHFHYSYFIKAAATIAQYDPDWVKLENYGGMIDLLIRDCANYDREDQRFPWMRNFDPYAGHSWASGHAGFASGNNQESSSESMNFATSLILYGEATNNPQIRDLGIYWHSTEAEAIRQYWFDVDQQVFPSSYGHRCVGMVWGDGGSYGTWWTANPEEIHGINYLPINGGSLYLGRDPEYIKANLANLRESNRNFHNGGFEGDPETIDRWHDVIAEYLALADAGQARREYDRWGKQFKPEFGETATHTHQWLDALKELGHFDPTIRADHPTAVAFKQGSSTNYVIYNSHSKTKKVTFSDGESFIASKGLQLFQTPNK